MCEPGANGKEVTQSEPHSMVRISITWDAGTNDFVISGLDTPPWIALGMLKYAEIQFRRRDAENAMREAMKNAPRIVRPGREV